MYVVHGMIQCAVSFSYEVACDEYSKALGLLHSSDDEEDEGARAVRASQSVIVEFIVNEVRSLRALVRQEGLVLQHVCVCVHVCVCMRACVCVCVRACV